MYAEKEQQHSSHTELKGRNILERTIAWINYLPLCTLDWKAVQSNYVLWGMWWIRVNCQDTGD